MKKNTIYFTHDSNARRDPKILALIADYGYEGYGRFWALIEFLREQDGHIEMTPINERALGFELGLSQDECKCFIDSLIEYGLLCCNGLTIFSQRLFESIEHLEGIRAKRKEAISKRWNKEPKTDDLYKCNTNVIQIDTKKTKEKNSKEKNSKENINNNNNTIEISEIPNDNGEPEKKTEIETEIQKIFIRFFSKNPNEADTLSMFKLINEFEKSKVEDACRIARDSLGDKINLRYVRGILINQANGITKEQNNGNNGNTRFKAGNRTGYYKPHVKGVKSDEQIREEIASMYSGSIKAQ